MKPASGFSKSFGLLASPNLIQSHRAPTEPSEPSELSPSADLSPSGCRKTVVFASWSQIWQWQCVPAKVDLFKFLLSSEI